MAIDWNMLLGNALNTVSDELSTRQAEARQYKKEQKAAADRNYQLVQQRNMRAQQAGQLGKRAMGLGATKEQVVAAMSSGVTGVQEFYDKLTAAAAQMPGNRLGAEDIEAIMAMSNIPEIEQKYIDMPLDQISQQMYSQGSADSFQAPEKQGFMASFLNPMGSAERQLDRQEYAGGMSVADINAAARQAEYQSLFPESTLNLRDIKYYNADEVKDFTTMVLDAASNATTSAAGKARIEAARSQALVDGTDVTEAVARESKLLQIRATESLIRWGAQSYNEGGFFRHAYTEDLIVNQLGYGQQFYDNLKEEFGAVDLDPVVDEDDSDAVAEALGMTPVPEGDVEISLPPTDMKFEQQPTPTEDQQAAIDNFMSNKLIYTANTEYTRQQWDNMSRKERKERGLPESPAGGARVYFRDELDAAIAEGEANMQIKNHSRSERFKIRIKGRGTYHVTKEQLDSMTDAAFRGASPAIEIIEYQEGEDKVKNIPSNLLKRYQVGE